MTANIENNNELVYQNGNKKYVTFRGMCVMKILPNGRKPKGIFSITAQPLKQLWKNSR